jgi:hypothetical protein
MQIGVEKLKMANITNEDEKYFKNHCIMNIIGQSV